MKHAQSTRQVQWTYINYHIIPHLGFLYLHQVQTSHIQETLNDLAKRGNQSKLKHNTCNGDPLSSWTLKKIRALLLASFEKALQEGLIQNNPVKGTEPITVQTLQVAPFTPEQQKVFLEGTKNHRFHVAYQLLFFTGCRRSEILGLTWDCVDLDQRQIQIRKVLININGTPLLKEYPKTKSSVRTIPLHPSLVLMLRKHYAKQKLEAKQIPWNNEHNLVFCNKDGTPHSPSYFLHNFKNAIKKLDLPRKLRVHSTRHTFATNLLQLPGVSIADVQHLGGWADTRVVLDIYAHSVKDTHRNAVQRLFEHNQPKTKKSERKH